MLMPGKTGAPGDRAPRIFSPEYYDRLYEVEERHWWFVGMRKVAAALLATPLRRTRDFTALDAGCGTGILLEWLDSLGGGGTVIGLDLSPHALASSRTRTRASLVQGSVTALPFRPARFSLAVCFDTLQHLPQDGSDRMALEELRRVVCPGGLILLRTNSAWGRQGRPTSGDWRLYTPELLRSLAEASRLRVLRETYANALPALADVLFRRLALARRSGRQSDPGLRVRLLPWWLGWVNALLIKVLAGEARFLAEPSRRLAFGHSIYVLAERPHES